MQKLTMKQFGQLVRAHTYKQYDSNTEVNELIAMGFMKNKNPDGFNQPYVLTDVGEGAVITALTAINFFIGDPQ